MSRPNVVVVGMACRYPDAASPDELWSNVLAGRRAFRRLPDERMRHEDYYDADPAAPDRFYSAQAAVIEGFEFDRVKYRVAGSTFRSTDMTHWLALDTVARALESAGFPAGEGLAELTTGVVVGNSLTGEFSRANLMRLRWPYVRRTVGAALRERGWDDGALGDFLDGLEERYKQPFPAIDEDTLAGGLANTIAGRICNYFDLKGGGYTVDGACSSSLLAVATAGDALIRGDLDIAIAGGVDLSIDPFEVIGFAKTGALATGEMRVYDRRSNGFWPGEGCGMVVLAREEVAGDLGLFRYARLAGWGISSDGKGGITRPEAEGHRLAVRRAYEAAGFGFETVGYVEGHGTGTAVGDETELRALSAERRAAGPLAAPLAIGTVKGNIGHTKAAAGIAGLIKAIQVVRHQIIPPATGHVEPHPELTGDRPALRVPDRAELWPGTAPARAGVSSMGFGGINAHVVVEHADGAPRTRLGNATTRLVRSRQDAELLVLDGVDVAELRDRATHLAGLCARLSYAELGDLAATLQGELSGGGLRAAVLASSPAQAARRFEKLVGMLASGPTLDIENDIYFGSAGQPPRIGFLFPGQGAGRRGDGGALRRRFGTVDELYQGRELAPGVDPVDTAVAQPRIVTSSIAGLRVLAALGITAVGAAGHSLGELTALHWAGALSEAGVLDLAARRGRVMAQASSGDGTMAAIAAAPHAVTPLLHGEDVVIAGYNGPTQTVVSGQKEAVARVRSRASVAGFATDPIAVSHAFHSRAVVPASVAFGAGLAGERFAALAAPVYSTVTGGELPADTDLRDLLTRQVVEPVRFAEALRALGERCDLLVEVGPGTILSGLAGQITPGLPALSLAADSPSLAGLLRVAGCAFVLGAPVRLDVLTADRFTRPLPLGKQLRFFASPCETAPPEPTVPRSRPSAAVAAPAAPAAAQVESASAASSAAAAASSAAAAEQSSLAVLLRLAAQRAELPIEALHADSHPLDELHLSSITVGQIVNQAARELGVTAPLTQTSFATSTLGQLAQLLEKLREGGSAAAEPASVVRGVAPWSRPFRIALVPTPRAPVDVSAGDDGRWTLFGPADHPLGDRLVSALCRGGVGDGVLLCLPRDCDERHLGVIVEAAHAALARPGRTRFVAVGDRRSAAGLAKTLHLEAPQIATTVVTVPLPDDLGDDRVSELVAGIVADVAATTTFAEVVYDGSGVRQVPVLRPLAAGPASPDLALGPDDVLLVTGGGKGITFECALELGRSSGAALGLVGRSDPAVDGELAANLATLTGAGVRFRYVPADVTSAPSVKDAVAQVREALGEVTAVLHGAGRNEPAGLTSVTAEKIGRTLAPKIGGLQAVLAAVDPGSLRLLVTFGSIIGRAGLRGEADYALANDWLADLTRQVGEEHPSCRTICLEWTVWSGSGMGERLGVVETLSQDGVEPIPTEQGVALLRELIADPGTPGTVVVMSRAESLPTLTLDRPELPLLRFVDHPLVYYPGIELVAESELSASSDPYLADHELDGDLLFPAVLGIEAMAQAATALTGADGPLTLEEVELLRPIVVPRNGVSTIRVAALATGPGTVRVAIRSGDTGYEADHFRATLHLGHSGSPAAVPVDAADGWLPLRPAEDLYGPVLFQGARFQRVLGYRDLTATSCVADVSAGATAPWFAGFLPDPVVTGDPGARDAFMHALQCCVPDATLLPQGVACLELAAPGRLRGRVTVAAVERARDGDSYTYDVDVRDEAGALVERWQGLRLRAVRKLDGAGPWVPTLLGPYLERRTEQVLTRPLRCVVWPADAPAQLPAADDGAQLAQSCGAGVGFAVLGDRPVQCAVTAVDGAGSTGQPALAARIAAAAGESVDVAAARVRGALECLERAGAGAETLALAEPVADGRWVILRTEKTRVATFPTTLRGGAGPVVFTMMMEVA